MNYISLVSHAYFAGVSLIELDNTQWHFKLLYMSITYNLRAFSSEIIV